MKLLLSIDIVVSQEMIDTLDLTYQYGLVVLWSFLILLPLTSLISLIFFPPIWYLLETGIIYSNRNKIKGKMRSEVIDGVGNWFYKIFQVVLFDRVLGFGHYIPIPPIWRAECLPGGKFLLRLNCFQILA